MTPLDPVQDQDAQEARVLDSRLSLSLMNLYYSQKDEWQSCSRDESTYSFADLGELF